MAMASAWRSVMGTSAASVIRKSFFAPCSLVNGIFIDSPVYFNSRSAFDGHALFEFIMRTMQPGFVNHGLNIVATHRHGPVRMQKQIGAGDGPGPLHIIVACQSVGQRDAESSVDGGEVAEAGEEGFVEEGEAF